MKKLFLGLMSLMFSSIVLFGNDVKTEWPYKCEISEYVKAGLDKYFQASINSDTEYWVHKKAKRNNVWILGINIDKQAENEEEGYFKMLLEFKGNEYNIIQSTSYSCDGKVIRHDKPSKKEWTQIIPDTVADNISDEVNKLSLSNKSK